MRNLAISWGMGIPQEEGGSERGPKGRIFLPGLGVSLPVWDEPVPSDRVYGLAVGEVVNRSYVNGDGELRWARSLAGIFIPRDDPRMQIAREFSHKVRELRAALWEALGLPEGDSL